MKPKALFIVSDVRSGSTYSAETFAYNINSSYGVEYWDLAKEPFSFLEDNSTADSILNIYDQLWINQANMKSAKIMCAASSIIYRESKKNKIIEDIFFGSSASWIILRRRNKFRQAVSLAVAKKSSLFHYYGNPTAAPDNGIKLTNQEIYEGYKSILLSDDFLDVFSSKVKNSITFFYEDFVGNEMECIKKIINSFSLPFQSENLKLQPVKITPTAHEIKQSYEDGFRDFFLENYHS